MAANSSRFLNGICVPFRLIIIRVLLFVNKEKYSFPASLSARYDAFAALPPAPETDARFEPVSFRQKDAAACSFMI
jgi:hypothetical protein